MATVKHPLVTSGEGDVAIHLPNMFSDILSIDPVRNPHYDKVKAEADSWIAEVLGYTDRQAQRNARADFTYLVAFWAPSCDEETLRNMVDWQHWAFPWDDRKSKSSDRSNCPVANLPLEFDDGHLQRDLPAAAEEVIKMITLFDSEYPLILRDESPFRWTGQVNWQNFQKRASLRLQHRYKVNMREYMLGVLRQVNARKLEPNVVGVEGYMSFRRGTIGVMPCSSMVESALNLDLPDEVLDHPSIAACQRVIVDLIIFGNDVLGYRKDLSEGEGLNLVNVVIGQGYSFQGAIDEIGRMLDDRYRHWHEARARLPSWGAKTDADVSEYLDGLRNMALGSLLWGYHSGRYCTIEEGDRIKETGIIFIPKDVVEQAEPKTINSEKNTHQLKAETESLQMAPERGSAEVAAQM